MSYRSSELDSSTGGLKCHAQESFAHRWKLKEEEPKKSGILMYGQSETMR